MLNSNEPIKVFYDGQVFRPELPLELTPNTYYEISPQPVIPLREAKIDSRVALTDLYEFIEPAQVQAFLAENDFLAPFLQSAYPSIQTHFPTAKLTLEVVPAYTGSENYKLQIGLHWDKDRSQTLSAFSNLKSKWWSTAKKSLNNKVSIAIKRPNIVNGNFGEALREMEGKYEEIPAVSGESNPYAPNSGQVFSNAEL